METDAGLDPDLITQGFSFALAPTLEQEQFLSSCAGASRFWFNQGLGLVKDRLNAREAASEDERVSIPWSYHQLCSQFKAAERNQVAPWQTEVVCGSYMAGFEMLGRALQNFSNGRKQGRRVGFPRFKQKGRCRESVIWQHPRLIDARHVELDKRLGLIKTKEPLKKLLRLLARDEHARILRATVSRSSERRDWTISFTVTRSSELKVRERKPRRFGAAVGLDVGISARATLSTGETLANLHLLRDAQKKLRRLQRTLDRQRRANNPYNYNHDGTCKPRNERREWVVSNRQHETEIRISKLHERIANTRRDQAHKLTSYLVSEFGVIGVESLNVSGMMKNRQLSRAIGDMGWGEILRQLAYKTYWSDGSLLVNADRFYPSSKTCSGCGTVKTKLFLSERVFTCEHCGLSMDRDHNAALNLAQMALRVAQAEGMPDAYVARRGRETLNARGGLVRPELVRRAGQGPLKREGWRDPLLRRPDLGESHLALDSLEEQGDVAAVLLHH